MTPPDDRSSVSPLDSIDAGEVGVEFRADDFRRRQSERRTRSRAAQLWHAAGWEGVH
jgi:hypothetical protein